MAYATPGRGDGDDGAPGQGDGVSGGLSAALQRNRFPAKGQYNKVWGYVPKEAIPNFARYEGSEEDERRLFYVAVTRSEKYLFCSWAPWAENRLYRKPSIFLEELSRMTDFLTRDPIMPAVALLTPTPRRGEVNVSLSFSELKYFFECPYQFKLRYLYGFNSPIDEAIGYGRSLHNMLADVHRRALNGTVMSRGEIDGLLDLHFQTRYAYPDLEENLRKAAVKAIGRYLDENGADLDKVVYAEEDVELQPWPAAWWCGGGST